MRPRHGCVFEDTAPSTHPAALTAAANPLPSSFHTAAPAHTQATKQVAAPHNSDEQVVIELSDTSSRSIDGKEDMSCLSSQSPACLYAEQVMLDRPRSTRVARTPKRFLDGIPLAADSSERYAMLHTFRLL